MAVKLRLRRMGRKKRPAYRVVAADSRAPRDGRIIEQIGYYDPIMNPAMVEVDEERALYWLGVGAIPSDTVKSLLSQKGIILKFDLRKRGYSEDKIEEELKKWEVIQIEKQRRLETKIAVDQAKTETPVEEPVAEASEEPSAEMPEKPSEEKSEEPAAEKAEKPAEETPEVKSEEKSEEKSETAESEEEAKASESTEVSESEEQTAEKEKKSDEAETEKKKD